MVRSFIYPLAHQFFVSHIQHQWQGLATCLSNFLRHAVYRARQLWMRFVGFCADHHIGTFSGTGKGDGSPDAPAASGYKNGSVLHCAHCPASSEVASVVVISTSSWLRFT